MKLVKPALRRAAALSLCACLATPALAGVFSVTPVRIFMSPRDRAVAVTVVNEGDTEIVLQADIHSWAQKPDATDDLVLTEDLILSPPILKLAPRARQVVRLALVKPADASRQLTYRLIMREVPEARTQRDAVNLNIALALSMPVFITPPAAKRELKCTIEKLDGQPAAACVNTGTAYAQVRAAQLVRGGKTLAAFEGGAYLLPGARKLLPLKLADGLPGAGAAQLSVSFDLGRPETYAVTLP